MIFTAIFFAFSYLIAKHTGQNDCISRCGYAFNLCNDRISAFGIFKLGNTDLGELILLFAVACFATAGHYTMTLAFAAAPISVTQPATFLQLVWAVLVGSIIFGEEIDLYVIGGGGLILCSITFMSWGKPL